MTALTLSLDDVQYQWPGPRGFGLSIPHFELAAGETVLLLGESGSGKSTLLSLICGTVAPQSGRIALAGTDMAGLPGARRDRLRAESIGVIFQQFNLLPFGSVRDNILLPLTFAPGRRARVGATPQAEAARLCTALRLPDGVLEARAATLSVGQQQRVAVARALIGSPPLILADEPTSALDATSQGAFLELMFGQVRSRGSALLMVSHDPRLGAQFDRVVAMSDIAQSHRAAA